MIDEIEETRKEVLKEADVYQQNPKISAFKYLQHTEHLLSLLKQNEWVKCSERLPDKEKEYLIYPPHKHAGTTAYFWPYKDFNGHKEETFEIVSEHEEVSQISMGITHWMELPSAPQDKEDDN